MIEAESSYLIECYLLDIRDAKMIQQDQVISKFSDILKI
jgi:hypothetical protein